MNKDEVRKNLQSIQGATKKLREVKDHRNDVLYKMCGVSGVDYDKIAIKKSAGNSAENRAIKYVEELIATDLLYTETRFKLASTLENMIARMEKLTPREYAVIKKHYIEGKSRDAICQELGYTVDGFNYIQQQAFKKMSD